MSGSRLVLDTTVAVHYLNGVAPYVEWVRTFDVYLPAAIVGELTFGALNSHRAAANTSRYNQFIDRASHVIPATREGAAEYAVLRLELRRAGRPIPENDIWIVATCRHHGLPLATTDAHFSSIGLLQILLPR